MKHPRNPQTARRRGLQPSESGGNPALNRRLYALSRPAAADQWRGAGPVGKRRWGNEKLAARALPTERRLRRPSVLGTILAPQHRAEAGAAAGGAMDVRS